MTRPAPPSKNALFLAAIARVSRLASSPAFATAAFKKKSPSAKIYPRAASASAAAINIPKAPASKLPCPSLPAPAPSSFPSASSSPKPSPPPASTATAPPTSSPPSTSEPVSLRRRGCGIPRKRPLYSPAFFVAPAFLLLSFSLLFYFFWILREFHCGTKLDLRHSVGLVPIHVRANVL